MSNEGTVPYRYFWVFLWIFGTVRITAIKLSGSAGFSRCYQRTAIGTTTAKAVVLLFLNNSANMICYLKPSRLNFSSCLLNPFLSNRKYKNTNKNGHNNKAKILNAVPISMSTPHSVVRLR